MNKETIDQSGRMIEHLNVWITKMKQINQEYYQIWDHQLNSRIGHVNRDGLRSSDGRHFNWRKLVRSTYTPHNPTTHHQVREMDCAGYIGHWGGEFASHRDLYQKHRQFQICRNY